ncbi:uncharacterized protein EAE97_006353 [Botrytis byssoidea]|uniref:Uncharacterized protein n=1 Tax=Botrytis byssoidea TaxID=139641 RepID=A0A9P5INT4_9HELO|nr:uncharacterized protein EAE97_006353 [Botrytis byssoidea]KAF7942899.1 hypothetical protein EAE97_006353 [Botrytis byssoidea]
MDPLISGSSTNPTILVVSRQLMLQNYIEGLRSRLLENGRHKSELYQTRGADPPEFFKSDQILSTGAGHLWNQLITTILLHTQQDKDIKGANERL